MVQAGERGGPSVATSRRERSGCLTCRDRKKRCDQDYPVCDACRRLNFVCRREDPRRPRKPGRPRTSTAAHPAGSDSCMCLSSTRVPDISPLWVGGGDSMTGDPGSRRRLFLRYYTQALAALITTNLENNCFLSVFLPLAMDSPPFLDAILAWSSTHLALRDESYQSLALQCRGTALRSLTASLSSQQRQPEIELASCLVHCALESISGDTKQWFTHVEGAHQIIRSVCYPKNSTGRLDFRSFNSFEGKWLLRSFAYHDIMTTVTEDRRPLIVAGHYWLFDEQEPPDSLFGLGSKVMYLVSETSVLNVDILESQNIGVQQSDYTQRFERLEAELLSWQCTLPVSTTFSDRRPDDLVKLAEMYQKAALIHLWRIARRHHLADYTSIQDKIDGAVMDIIDRLKAIPERSLVESSLLFPLFLAGGETIDPDHVEIVRHRMRDMVDFRHFHNVEAVLEILEELWHLRWSGKAVDWRDVLGRKKWMLSLT